ncbi:MAG: YraN family protein [Prevotellaceae bacterium]|nr:YraN family protein [Prevotella sp.]MDD7257625.1 YraN family protein [Prevotellaceae bacterium]MDY6131243.1 YraN family protein [Prevotella sp.]
MAAHNELGKWGEQVAARYLAQKGYRLLARNWKDGHRDLDIVAADGPTLVVVEVKTRRNNVFNEPEEAVDWRKVRSLSLAAGKYVKIHGIDADIRFDIVAVTGTDDDNCRVNHIENAFLPAGY